MKKLLGILVLGIGCLVYFIWPTDNRMVDYCAYSKFGIQTKYSIHMASSDNNVKVIRKNVRSP